MIFHKANDLLVNSSWKRTTAAVATCVEPSLNVISDVFIEIIHFDIINEGVSVYVTQSKFLTIRGLHVVVMGFIHDDLTQIEDGLPEVNGFVHYKSDLPHLTPHQVLTEEDSLFKVQLHHLEVCLLVHKEIDVPMLPDVLHCLPKQ